MPTHSHHVGSPTAFCRTPAEWWKSPDLVWALVHHPSGGYVKVATVAEAASGEASYLRVAERVLVSCDEVKTWEAELQAIVEQDLWQAFVQRRQATAQAQPNQFLTYYGS